jgi:hypothetical protein
VLQELRVLLAQQALQVLPELLDQLVLQVQRAQQVPTSILTGQLLVTLV